MGLLILILITGLFLLLSPPPRSEPLGTPDGMLASGGPGSGGAAALRPLSEETDRQAGQLVGLPVRRG